MCRFPVDNCYVAVEVEHVGGGVGHQHGDNRTCECGYKAQEECVGRGDSLGWKLGAPSLKRREEKEEESKGDPW